MRSMPSLQPARISPWGNTLAEIKKAAGCGGPVQLIDTQARTGCQRAEKRRQKGFRCKVIQVTCNFIPIHTENKQYDS